MVRGQQFSQSAKESIKKSFSYNNFVGNSEVVQALRKPGRAVPVEIPEDADAATKEILDELADILPSQINYAPGSAVAVSSYLHSAKHLSPSISALGLARITQVWNVGDGVAQIIAAASLFMDTESHNQMAQKIKGAALTASAAQLIGLTLYSAAMFGGPTFAIATGVDFAVALHQLIKDTWRTSFTGWLTDSYAELAYVDTRRHEAMSQLQTFKNSKKPEDTQAYQKAQKNLYSLTQRKSALEYLIRMRLLANPAEAEKHNAKILTKVAKRFQYKINLRENLGSKRLKFYEQGKKDLENFGKEMQLLVDKKDASKLNSAQRKKIKQANASLQKKLTEKSEKSLGMAVLKGISFAGMTLLAFTPLCPALIVPGLALITIASVAYLAIGIKKLHEKVKQKKFQKAQRNKAIKLGMTDYKGSHFYPTKKPKHLISAMNEITREAKGANKALTFSEKWQLYSGTGKKLSKATKTLNQAVSHFQATIDNSKAIVYGSSESRAISNAIDTLITACKSWQTARYYKSKRFTQVNDLFNWLTDTKKSFADLNPTESEEKIQWMKNLRQVVTTNPPPSHEHRPMQH